MAQETKRIGCHNYIKRFKTSAWSHLYLFFKFILFGGGHIVRGILVSQPRIEPRPMVVKAPEVLNH